MAMSKVVLGFFVAGALAACSGEQGPAASDAAWPAGATQAGAGPLKDQVPAASASGGDSFATFNSNP